MGKNAGTNEGAESGTGNVVSAEFNLCYRWHSCISAKDEKWVEEFYSRIFEKPLSNVTTTDMYIAFGKFEKSIPEDPSNRTFGGFRRGPDGKFSDDDLVECISSAVEDVAGAFGACNVPAAMRSVEILGILQGRKWNVAGLNEFRKHFGLKPYERFEDINSDPAVADRLRHLYEHPDFVELYAEGPPQLDRSLANGLIGILALSPKRLSTLWFPELALHPRTPSPESSCPTLCASSGATATTPPTTIPEASPTGATMRSSTTSTSTTAASSTSFSFEHVGTSISGRKHQFADSISSS
jgi:hypothetical protein